MKLSDVMSAAGLAGWAEAALIIFFLAFLLVCLRVLRGDRRWHRARYLPLDGDTTARAEKDEDHD
jgi:hypothetical protein